MERFSTLAIMLTTLLVPWLEPTPGRAQAPSTPALAAPDSIPPPRAFAVAQPQPAAAATAEPAQARPAPPTPAVSPAVGPPLTQGSQNLPPALQPSPARPAPSTGLDQTFGLNAAPLESTDLKFPINLATALRLSDARPLLVAAAQASVWVAEAQLTRAKVLWVPQLDIGFDYTRHDGGGPDFNKGILTAPSVNFFYGGGGLIMNVATSDIIFQPLVARQTLTANQAGIQTAKNDALQMTADAYFQVHQYRGMYTGALYAIERGHDLIERIAQLSKDLVPKVEVDRARNFVADLEQQATSAREQWRVHSADLTQVLRLDPRAIVVPLEHDHLQITLIDPGRTFDDLMPVALTNRPELTSQQALVQAALNALRREKVRPLTPTIMTNGFQTPGEYIQGGIFGLGPNNTLNQWDGRDDISLQPLWQLEACGIGNLARIKEQRGMQSLAIIEFYRTQDRIAAEVTRSMARLQSATARISQADRALRTAIITFNGNFEGLKQTTRFGNVLVLVNRPQEVVFALQLLKLALDDYFTTVAEYNRAQFEVFHALGYPAREITYLRPPGEVQPVDTTRPDYLPPVGNGPPPATR
jgi:outer membrane protein TolC